MSNKKQVDRMNIFFRVKAAPELGMGHLVRCLALAEKLKDLAPDMDITFITSSNAVSDRVRSCGYGSIDLPLSVSMVEEIKHYKKCLNKSIIITDIPNIPEQYIHALKENGCIVVSIDDCSKTLFYSDILINPNLNPCTQHAYSSGTQYYSGAEYVILKKAFEKYAGKKKRIKEKVESLFLCFGGGDNNNITGKIVNIIKEIEIDTNVVIGMLYPYKNELIKSVEEHKNIKIKINANNIDELIDEADLAMISGGTMLYEICAVGTPAIIICQNEDQNTECEFFAQTNAAINFGVYDKINKEAVLDTVHNLINDHKNRMLLSKNAKQLIDAKGADRIVKIIKGYFRK
ncbi:MAG: UDP-2,4-diacetamido-2,4,6-trideoxy-beta-L-altropyranose hydrolase [Candidatus Methanoperedens sp.]|nr:UDP-2,4-diacetamido-2,4,6-trideoxy-beta-L-altropyranose hydrolase [Candidatus Methanoperedens sp.]